VRERTAVRSPPHCVLPSSGPMKKQVLPGIWLT